MRCGRSLDEVDVLDGLARIAAHAKARRKHEAVTFSAHHPGIPLGARGAHGKILVSPTAECAGGGEAFPIGVRGANRLGYYIGQLGR
jgi:hypothetical protein